MSANDRQVGGTHYGQGDRPQHWDLVQMYEWDYFQAQVVKYLMRWKTKHSTPEKRLEDLKKAHHFLDKYIEGEEKRLRIVLQAQDTVQRTKNNPLGLSASEYMAGEVNVQAGLRRADAAKTKFTVEGYHADGTALYKCKKCGAEHWRFSALQAEAAHGSCAGKGYVKQG